MATEPLDHRTSATSGWVAFAGVVTAVAASANLVFGCALLLKDNWVAFTPEALVRFDATTVGVTYLIFGAIQLFVAMGIFGGELWARMLGVGGAALNLLAHMSFHAVYPAWSWLIIIVDGLIIYGLTVHGDEVARW